MFRAVRNVRLLIIVGAASGVTVAGLVSWLTGFASYLWQSISSLAARVEGQVTTWLDAPMSLDKLLTGGLVIAVPVVVIAAVFVLTDL